jgi:hypothetical protein
LSQNLKSLWRFNMAMDLTETGCEGVKWIQMVQDTTGFYEHDDAPSDFIKAVNILTTWMTKEDYVHRSKLTGQSGVRAPAGAGNFSLHHRVQTNSGAHPASYPMGTRSSFPGTKAACVWGWPLTSI